MDKFEIGDIVYGVPNGPYIFTNDKAKMMVVDSSYFPLDDEDDKFIFLAMLEQFDYPKEVGMIYKVNKGYFTKDVPLRFVKKDVISTIDNNISKNVQDNFTDRVHDALLQILLREEY